MSSLAYDSMESVGMQQKQLVDEDATAGQLAKCWTMEGVWDAAGDVLQG